MNMKLNVRQNSILHLLQQSETLEVEKLAEHFDVSTQTIRKDINQLSEVGLARRVHGGVSLPTGTHNISFHSRELINAPLKRQLAETFAEQVPDGASLILGIGTTMSFLARALLQHKNLRVFTNNLNVAAVLCAQPEIEVLMTGGALRHADQDLIGESVTRFFDHFHVDYGVLGGGGLSSQHGILEYDPLEGDVSRSILRNCDQSVLLADHSKWQRRAGVKVAGFDAIDYFFTDELPSLETEQVLASANVEVVTVEAGNH